MREMVWNENEYQPVKHRGYAASVTTQLQQLWYVSQVYGIEIYGTLNEIESQTNQENREL
jgi:hypothetical protein